MEEYYMCIKFSGQKVYDMEYKKKAKGKTLSPVFYGAKNLYIDKGEGIP